MPRVAATLARGAAFTLVELLVVVALIAFLAGGIGLALRDGGGSALATAQAHLASMLGTARVQAAVHQAEAIVAIYGSRPPTGEADKFLRLIQVFRKDPAGSASWLPVGSPVLLPAGVYVVPPSTTGLLASGVVWPANPPLLSTLAGPVGLSQPAGTPFGGSATAYTFQFNPDGSVKEIEERDLAHARLVVATAAVAGSLPQFNNSGAVRGVLVRRTGAVTFVNDANAF